MKKPQWMPLEQIPEEAISSYISLEKGGAPIEKSEVIAKKQVIAEFDNKKKEETFHQKSRLTIVMKIDSLSSTHLKVNMALNFVMITLTAALVTVIPYISLREPDNNHIGYIYLQTYYSSQPKEVFRFATYRSYTEEECGEAFPVKSVTEYELCLNSSYYFLAAILTSVSYGVSCVLNILSVIFTWNSIRHKKKFYCSVRKYYITL